MMSGHYTRGICIGVIGLALGVVAAVAVTLITLDAEEIQAEPINKVVSMEALSTIQAKEGDIISIVMRSVSDHLEAHVSITRDQVQWKYIIVPPEKNSKGTPIHLLIQFPNSGIKGAVGARIKLEF